MDIGSDWEGWDFPRPSSPPSAGGMESQTLWSLWRTNFLDSFPPPSVIFFLLTADLSGVTTWLAKAKQALFKPEEIMLDQLIWRMAGSGIMPGYHVQSLKAHLTTGFLISCWLIWRTQRRRTLQNSIDSLFPIDTHGTMHAIFTEQLSISHKKAVLVVAVSLTSIQDNEVSRFDKWTKSLFQDVKMVRHLSAYMRSCAAMIWGSLHTAD